MDQPAPAWIEPGRVSSRCPVDGDRRLELASLILGRILGPARALYEQRRRTHAMRAAGDFHLYFTQRKCALRPVLCPILFFVVISLRTSNTCPPPSDTRIQFRFPCHVSRALSLSGRANRSTVLLHRAIRRARSSHRQCRCPADLQLHSYPKIFINVYFVSSLHDPTRSRRSTRTCACRARCGVRPANRSGER